MGGGDVLWGGHFVGKDVLWKDFFYSRGHFVGEDIL
jgi:hypothetical protein